jgi:hypothetical protein
LTDRQVAYLNRRGSLEHWTTDTHTCIIKTAPDVTHLTNSKTTLAHCNNSYNDLQRGSQQAHEQSKSRRGVSVERDHHPATRSRPMDLFYAFVCLCPSPFTCLSLPRALTISTCPSSLCLHRLFSPSHPICINFSISVPPPTGHLPLMIMFKSHSTALHLFPPPYLYRIIATLCLGVFTSCHSMSWLFHYVFPEPHALLLHHTDIQRMLFVCTGTAQ